METKNEKYFPATKTVEWVDGPTDMCDAHAQKAMTVWGLMGAHIVVTLAKEDGVCVFCLNKDKSK